MSKPYYVTLTGSRNNAGDFLIRHRAHALLRHLRPDRNIVDMNSWEAFSDEQLEIVNGAVALILLGGPALRQDMYPKVYPLVADLDRIKVPITIMGAGWHASPGTWEDSREYTFTPATLRLLQRIDAGTTALSVRDYRSLNALAVAGISNGVMTGCPALYIPENIGSPFVGFPKAGVKNLVVSPGVTFIRSAALEQQLKNLIAELQSGFPDANLTVAFHHSIQPDVLKKAYDNDQTAAANRQLALVEWLNEQGVDYIDVSGGVEKLIQLYDAADFHVGYRVHAHIFMCSQRKPSVLLTEDGRGRGLKDVLGGVIFDSWKKREYSVKDRIRQRVTRQRPERYVAFSGIAADVKRIVSYEAEFRYPRFSQPKQRIDLHYAMMKGYIMGLP
ncbi:polysaccharide pyruvyl transferase family protein [Neolewinella persica]|uniref:polysaccharide pyruvyl transferase family protein n=1 Tax=Neolewinella persica TaxID=70998 RepID=UPI00037454D6|nr:polysaccharide pyruvyl transferase family protein [Neolewinella persica]